MPRITSFSQSGLEIEALHPPMLDAFSDYIVSLQPSKDALMEILESRGFDPESSFVALDGKEIAAFWGVASRGQKRYLIVSGTRVDHRGKGLSSALGNAAIQAAKDVGCESFWLEVITGNDKAESLYTKLGFQSVRTLNCYRLDHPNPELSTCYTTDFERAKTVFQEYATWGPTWQNEDETISALDLTCFLHSNGAAVVSKGGFVHQIAAADQAALADLLAAAATIGPLILVNIDTKDDTLNTLLVELGADKFVQQSEMCISF